MKNLFRFSVLMVLLMTSCVMFSSCSKDDDDDGNGSNSKDFYEYTIDGKTYKNDEFMVFNDYLDSGTENGKKFNSLGFIEHETANYYFEIGVMRIPAKPVHLFRRYPFTFCSFFCWQV